MFEKLKRRWNIASNFQVIIIMVIFAITGSTTVIVKKLIFDLIGITPETRLWVEVPVYIAVILTVYNILLQLVGWLFGQFKFFLNFEKKFFSWFIFWKSIKTLAKANF